MANLKSAIKRVQTNRTKQKVNQPYRARMRSKIKEVEALIEANELEKATTAFHQAIRIIDRTIQKGIIHRNNGSRQKARLAKHINELKNEEVDDEIA